MPQFHQSLSLSEQYDQEIADLRLQLADLLEAREGTAEVVATKHLIAQFGIRGCLNRFLTARGGKVDAAEKMFREVVSWRAEMADTIFEALPALSSWDVIRPYWMAVHFVANGGTAGPIPMTYCVIAHILPLYLNFTEEQLTHAYVRFMEAGLQQQFLACEERRRWQKKLAKSEGMTLASATSSLDFGLPQMVEIYDLSGVGLSHLRCLAGLRCLSRILSIGQRFYPENLSRAFVLNSPRIFDKLWSIVGQALHENTRRKMVITAASSHPELREAVGWDEFVRLQGSIAPFGIGPSNMLRPTNTHGELGPPRM